MRDWDAIDALSEIFAEVPDLVLAFTADGRYLYVNATAAVFLGAEPIDVVGYHWRELGYPAEVMLPFTSRVEKVATSGAAEHYRFTSSSERGRRTFDASLTPLWSTDGNLLAVLAICHDISEFFER